MNKRKCPYFILLSFQNDSEPMQWMSLKVNQAGSIVGYFSSKDFSELNESVDSFLKYLSLIDEYLFVGNYSDVNHFIKYLNQNKKRKEVDTLIQCLKNRFWDIKTDCIFQFHLPQNTSLEELVFLYGEDFQMKDKLLQELYQLRSLVIHFLYDKQKNQELRKLSKTELEKKEYHSFNVEKLIQLVLNKNVIIECRKNEEKMEFIAKKENHILFQKNVGSLKEGLVLFLLDHKN